MIKCILFVFFFEYSLSCTTLGVGILGTKDRKVMCSQSDDGDAKTDPRIMYVPGKNFSSGEVRKIAPDVVGFPRFVGAYRSEDYSEENCKLD
jgi:hypothetical protein